MLARERTKLEAGLTIIEQVHAIYEGNYKDGKKAGTGKMTYPNGDEYTGEWKDNAMEGEGTYVYKVRCCSVGAGENPKTYQTPQSLENWADLLRPFPHKARRPPACVLVDTSLERLLVGQCLVYPATRVKVCSCRARE